MNTVSLPLIGVMAIVTGITFQQGIDAVYEVCDGMTGDSNYTHQLIRVSHEVTPALLEQFPWLRDVQLATEILKRDNKPGWYKEFRDRMIAEHGERLDVIPMHPEDHRVVDPITELLEMKPDAKIVTFNPDEDTPSDIGDITPTTR